MVNIGLLAAKIGLPVWGTPAHFNGFRLLAALLQRRRPPEANQTLHDVWPSSGLLHYIYILGALIPDGICQVQNSVYIQVLRSPIVAALLHGILAATVSQTLWRGTGNDISELSQTAPSIFGWAAITLDIGPHSSLVFSERELAFTFAICYRPSVCLSTDRRTDRQTTLLRL